MANADEIIIEIGKVQWPPIDKLAIGQIQKSRYAVVVNNDFLSSDDNVKALQAVGKVVQNEFREMQEGWVWISDSSSHAHEVEEIPRRISKRLMRLFYKRFRGVAWKAT